MKKNIPDLLKKNIESNKEKFSFLIALPGEKEFSDILCDVFNAETFAVFQPIFLD